MYKMIQYVFAHDFIVVYFSPVCCGRATFLVGSVRGMGSPTIFQRTDYVLHEAHKGRRLHHSLFNRYTCTHQEMLAIRTLATLKDLNVYHRTGQLLY